MLQGVTNTFKRMITSSSLTKTNNLGRWALVHKHSVVFKKVDLANEDHCGCCVVEEPEMNDGNNEDITVIAGCMMDVPSHLITK